MFERISLKSMCSYEKLTGKNAMELFSRENKSATDLRDLVYMIKYTKDQTVTFDTIENLSTEDFQNAITSISEEKK
jgi:glycosylphosphatidylinositol transamidase (GPIT) subunit GPI8